MTQIIHTFATEDQRSRITWQGQTYRAVRIEQSEEYAANDVRGLSVWLVRTTKKGADFKRADSFMWLTLTNSLDRQYQGRELANYVRELTGHPALPEPVHQHMGPIPKDCPRCTKRAYPR